MVRNFVELPTAEVLTGDTVGKSSLEVDFIDTKEIEKEIKYIDNLLNIAGRDVNNAPEGTLRIAHSHGTEQYYHVTKDSGTHGEYISKKNLDLVQLLDQKDYKSFDYDVQCISMFLK